MKVKTADLIGPALDWAVAKCEGFSIEFESDNGGRFWLIRTNHAQQYLPPFGYLDETFFPSSDWSQGGPIIEQEGINIFKHNTLDESLPDVWCAHKVVPRPNMEGSFNSCALAIDGPTPLIAAMRCVVASRLGEEVDIPDELV